MEVNITSVKTAVKERLDAINDYMKNLPEIKILIGNDRLNIEKVDFEYARILELDHQLRRLILASENLQSIISEAMSVLSNNLEIELRQKTMLRKSLDILKNRTDPLKIELTNNANKIFYYQSLQKRLR